MEVDEGDESTVRSGENMSRLEKEYRSVRKELKAELDRVGA
jgi:hypothetical protein